MSITELLNIKYPIFQGAMAQISHYQLAAAEGFDCEKEN